MKEFYCMLICYCFIVLGCKEQTINKQLDSEMKVVEAALGLNLFANEWTQDSTTYWTRTGKNNRLEKVENFDTLVSSDYLLIETYRQTIKEHLKVQKLIKIDPKSNTKISTRVSYTCQLNPDIESMLDMTYNYKDQAYHNHFVDTSATNLKMETNRAITDSLLNTVEKEGLYLCGTALNEILWKDIPFLPVPKEINKDAALVLIRGWIEEL